jgi:hypothetical protein
MDKKRIEIKVGQIWRENDARFDRRVIIEKVDGDDIYVRTLGRTSKNARSRFNGRSRGYSFDGVAESEVARLRRERDRLKKSIADMEADCACLPEDRSVTETVARLRRERDEARAASARAAEAFGGWWKDEADGILDGLSAAIMGEKRGSVTSAPEVMAVDGYAYGDDLNADDIFDSYGDLLVRASPHDNDEVPVRVIIIEREGEK